MANEVDYSPQEYTGNGTTRTFSYNWKTFEKTDLIIKLINNGTESILTLGTDYQVEIESVGGVVILTTAPANGVKIRIERLVSQYQQKRYSTSTGFQGDEIEKSFDRTSCNIQDMQHTLDVFQDNVNSEIEEFESSTNTLINSYKDEIDSDIADFQDDVNADINTFKQQTNSAISAIESTANTANTTANTANTKSNNATQTANTASTKADNAISIAGTATTYASNAVTTANAAEATAESAKSIANAARTKSTEALQTAQNAVDIAETAHARVDEFAEDIQTVLDAAADIEQLQQDMEDVNTLVEETTEAAEEATAAARAATATVANKVNKTGDTMTGQLKIKKSGMGYHYLADDINFTTLPSATISVPAFRISDTNENRMASLQYVQRADGSHALEISDKKDNNTASYSAITVGWDKNGNQYASAPRPVNSNSTTDGAIATTGWVNDATASLNIVHKDTAEIITGQKTFTDFIQLQGTSQVVLRSKNTNNYSTASTAGTNYSDLIFTDYTGDRRLTIRGHYGYDATGTLTSEKIIIGTNKFDASAPSGLEVGYNGITGWVGLSDGYRPTATNSTSNNNVATCGWVNDATMSTNVVHRDTAETIAGLKTFTDNPTIERSTYSRCVLKTTGWTKGTNPASSTNSGIVIEDVNSDGSTAHRMGEFITQFNSNGSINSAMGVYKNEVGTTNSQIRIGYNSSGKLFTYAPASDANDSIVTTVAKSKAESGYFKFGNGLIIQWGSLSSTNNTAVTFPTAFTSTNYYAHANFNTQTNRMANQYGVVNSKTTTGCSFVCGTVATDTMNWIAIGY